MSNGVEIGNTVAVMNPKALLTGVLKAGVVTLTFGPESVSSLKGKTGAVNGKTVVIGNSDILGAAAVFLAIVPVLVVTGTGRRCGLPERAAEFLTCPSSVGGFSIFVHGKPSGTDGMAGRKLLGILGIPWIQGNYSITLVHIADKAVNGFYIVSLVGNESTFRDGNNLICFRKDTLCDRRIRDVGRCSQFPDRQAGNAVHKHMIFVAPIILKVFSLCWLEAVWTPNAQSGSFLG